MAYDEPRLPLDAVGALKVARDQVMVCIDDWSRLWRHARTIGHPGLATQEFLRKQTGKGFRSVVSILGGDNDRLAGGASVQFDVLVAWFIVMPGTLEDRTDKGLTVSGEAVKFVTLAPWMDLEAGDVIGDPGDQVTIQVDSCWSRTPVGGSVKLTTLYKDKDEKNGLSIWMVRWKQAVDLGTAGREKAPAYEPLALIDGTDIIEGAPNPDTLETTVE